MNPLNNLPGVGATAKDSARAKDSATAKDPARAKDPGMRSAAEAGLRRTTRQIPARRRPGPDPTPPRVGRGWRILATPSRGGCTLVVGRVRPTTAALRRRAGPPPAPPRSGAPASRIPHSMAS